MCCNTTSSLILVHYIQSTNINIISTNLQLETLLVSIHMPGLRVKHFSLITLNYLIRAEVQKHDEVDSKYLS